jgi:hydroxymethylpyrimidine kinase / phosphomethylpyrimidine kinase / thiamine-phosphate diphosphorylase
MLKLVVDHSAKERIAGLYLITDQGERLVERVREALSGGVTVLQYRDKVRSREQQRMLGHQLKQLCSDAQVKFIVNDDVELAVELNADGVHLGQDDGDPAAARAALGPEKLSKRLSRLKLPEQITSASAPSTQPAARKSRHCKGLKG